MTTKETVRTKITVRNFFHDTSINMVIEIPSDCGCISGIEEERYYSHDLSEHLSGPQRLRAARELCGISTCECGGIRSGDQPGERAIVIR